MQSRALIAGAVVLVCAVGVFFVFRPHGVVSSAGLSPEATDSTDQLAADVKPGYVGVAKFGSWRLICSASGASAPQDTAATGTAVDPATQISGNACRVNQEIPVAGKPDQVLLAANFGVLGALHRAALMLRLPPTVHAGDVISLRIDSSHTLRTPVRNCTDKECIAAASLTDDNWSDLLSAGSVQIAFPIADNQKILVDLPMNGFEDAITAVNLAQSAAAVPVGEAPAPAPAADAAPALAAAAPAPTAPAKPAAPKKRAHAKR